MDTQAAETPMRDHVERFFRLLETEHVRILVEIRRQHGEGQPVYWDSSSFPNDAAKAIAAAYAVRAGTCPSVDEAAFLIWCESHRLTAADRSSPYWLECWEHHRNPKTVIDGADNTPWTYKAARALLAQQSGGEPTTTLPEADRG